MLYAFSNPNSLCILCKLWLCVPIQMKWGRNKEKRFTWKSIVFAEALDAMTEAHNLSTNIHTYTNHICTVHTTTTFNLGYKKPQNEFQKKKKGKLWNIIKTSNNMGELHSLVDERRYCTQTNTLKVYRNSISKYMNIVWKSMFWRSEFICIAANISRLKHSIPLHPNTFFVCLAFRFHYEIMKYVHITWYRHTMDRYFTHINCFMHICTGQGLSTSEWFLNHI